MIYVGMRKNKSGSKTPIFVSEKSFQARKKHTQNYNLRHSKKVKEYKKNYSKQYSQKKSQGDKYKAIGYTDVNNIISYNAITGILTAKITLGLRSTGEEAGSLHNAGRKVVCLFGRTYLYHKICWLLHYGEWPNKEIDHINGNPSDNRICNLRLATRVQNAQNTKLRSDNKSGAKGVRFDKGKWQAEIHFNRKRIYLGRYSTFEKALSVRKEAEIKYHLEYARK